MTVITEEVLKEMEAHADNEQWSRGDEGGDYPNYINWCEPMQGNIHTLAAEVRRLRFEHDQRVAKQTEAEHAAALWMKRAKEMEASYEDLRLRYAQGEALVKRLTDPLVKAELAKPPAPIVLHQALVDAANKVADAGCPPPDYKAAWRAHQQLLAALGRTT